MEPAGMSRYPPGVFPKLRARTEQPSRDVGCSLRGPGRRASCNDSGSWRPRPGRPRHGGGAIPRPICADLRPGDGSGTRIMERAFGVAPNITSRLRPAFPHRAIGGLRPTGGAGASRRRRPSVFCGLPAPAHVMASQKRCFGCKHHRLTLVGDKRCPGARRAQTPPAGQGRLLARRDAPRSPHGRSMRAQRDGCR